MKSVARRVSVAVAAAAAVLSTGFVSPASSAPAPDRPYDPRGGSAMRAAAVGDAQFIVLMPKHTDPNHTGRTDEARCADVAWASMANEARTILFDCYSHPNQEWAPIWVEGTNPEGTVMFVNNNSGKCLDLWNNSPVDGAPIIQWNCHNGWNQQWEVVLPSGWTSGQPIQFRNRRTGKCLDVNYARTANNTELLQWQCHQNDNQKWTMYYAL